MTGEGIHQASGSLPSKHMIQAALVASNARVDLIGLALPGFVYELRIR
jgi:hypothetical protein